MKVAVSSKGKDLESEVSEVFGRCPFFIIAEINDKIENFEAFENKSANQVGGAGVTASQFVAEKDVKAVITGNIGPRALDIFRQFKIEVFKGSGQVKEVLQNFLENKLEKVE